MPEKWTGSLIGDMHTERVTQKELAAELCCTNEYVCMVLNGKKTPKGGEDRFRAAFRNIVERRKADASRV